MMYMTRDELEAVTVTAHDRGKKVRAHCPSRIAILEGAKAGVDLIDHADRMDAECIDAILEADVFVLPSMLWSVRLLEIAENWDHAAAPFPIGEQKTQTLEETMESIRGVRADFEHTCQMLPEAVKAGVKLVVGDDFGTPIMPHGDYVSEMEFYVKQLGISAQEVLRWATRNGADAMDALDERGTIAAGKLADLLVVDGDPLSDITCLRDTTNLRAIMLDGKLIKDLL
jgi:imidazolonepropionase-like amidohydrolase